MAYPRTLAALLAGLMAASAANGEPPPRKYYGAKFEPVDGILHGAGQTYHRDTPDGPVSQGFHNYADVVGDDRFPLLYMDYTGWSATTDTFYDGMKSRLDAIQAQDNRMVVPQLGLVLPPGEQLLTDLEVENIIDGLRHVNRQIFFRPGYEANGPWNNLHAPTFIANYRKIADRVREEELPVAMVWNVVVGDGGGWSAYANADDYYPGDEYVDWWAFNIFGRVTFDVPFWELEVDKFLNAADAAGKPVLIGEATPQYTGAEDPEDWEDWFAKFFARIEDNPGIKAHTYINWDWGATNPADNWTDWLDARLEAADPTVRANYLERIGDPAYLHAGAGLPEFFREGLAGDYNGDGVVDAADYTVWRNNEGATGLLPFSGADGNGDGVVNEADREVWRNAFGADDQSSMAVPEPAGASAGAAALLFWSTRRPTPRVSATENAR